MLVKRLLVIILSLGIGFGLAVAIIYAPFIANTTLEEFGFYYTFFLSLALGCAVAIWLDKFLDTQILPK